MGFDLSRHATWMRVGVAECILAVPQIDLFFSPMNKQGIPCERGAGGLCQMEELQSEEDPRLGYAMHVGGWWARGVAGVRCM